MKKILITEEIETDIEQALDFLKRQDIKVMTAGTNDDLLQIHQRERAGLIIAALNTPGMKSEDLYSSIRKDRALRAVSVILLCQDTPADIERSHHCNANTVMLLPIDIPLLRSKVQQLLDISWRESYRVLLSVTIEGASKDRTFFCKSENLSTTGMLMETERELAKGDRIQCSFFLPDSKKVRTSGEIMRVIAQAAGSKTNRYGVKFDRLPADTKAAIDDFVDKKSRTSVSRK